MSKRRSPGGNDAEDEASSSDGEVRGHDSDLDEDDVQSSAQDGEDADAEGALRGLPRQRRSGGAGQNDEESEGEGEDLLADGYERDYRAIGTLDVYDNRGMDHREYDDISMEARRAAEAEMRRRDRMRMRQSGARLPIALQESDDEGSEFDHSRARRVMAERAAGEGMDFDEDNLDFALDDFQCPLKEWISQDRPRREVKKQFREFLRTYFDPDAGAPGENVYHEKIKAMCAANQQSLVVSYLHISQAVPILAIWLADAPKQMLEIFNEVATEVVMQDLFPDYAAIHEEIYVRITALPIKDSLRELRQIHLNGLIKVGGVVTRRGGVFPQLKLVTYCCNNCGASSPSFPSNGGEVPKPQMCHNCEAKSFRIDTEKTIYRNYQKLTLQETPGSVPAGRVPRYKEIVLIGDLIDSARPGEEVEITGIYMNSYDVRLNARQGFPVFSTVIEANYVERQSNQEDRVKLTEEDRRKIQELAKDPCIGERIVKSIAPSIYGNENIKRAVALAMFGGREKNIKNKHRVRGDINVLLLGDPGTAKSQFLKYVEKTAPRVVYTTGKGASAVGLTAMVHKDPVTHEWTLEGGALVLADRGICLIDEFDKMNDADRTSIHEAMEQQSISISKAGIVATLKARCAVIAAANPIGGRYDPQRSLADNVELTDPILSRFDVLCVLVDEVDPIADERLANFVVNSHMSHHPDADVEEEGVAGEAAQAQDPSVADQLGGEDETQLQDGTNGTQVDQEEPVLPLQDKDDGIITQELLRKYIVYARSTVRPQLQNIDQERVAQLYADLRRDSISAGGVPIAVRHVESIMRMAEGYAKMHLRPYVRDDDLDMAIRVMVESFISAQKYAVQRTLRRKFHKYLVHKKDNNSLLMYLLQTLVREQQTYRSIGPSNGQQVIEVQLDDLEARARELNIHNLQTFFKSDVFNSHGFELDTRERTILRAI